MEFQLIVEAISTLFHFSSVKGHMVFNVGDESSNVDASYSTWDLEGMRMSKFSFYACLQVPGIAVLEDCLCLEKKQKQSTLANHFEVCLTEIAGLKCQTRSF